MFEIPWWHHIFYYFAYFYFASIVTACFVAGYFILTSKTIILRKSDANIQNASTRRS